MCLKLTFAPSPPLRDQMKREKLAMLIRYPRRVTVNNKRLISKRKKSREKICIYKSHSIIKYYKEIIRNFVGEKGKWTNKGTDTQYVADYLLHSTTCHTRYLYQISKS